MTDSLLQKAERLVIQCRATSDSPHGSPLREPKMILEHRQMVAMLDALVEQGEARETFVSGFLLRAKNIFENSSTGTNGQRSWSRAIPQNVKTSLIMLYQFIQRHR